MSKEIEYVTESEEYEKLDEATGIYFDALIDIEYIANCEHLDSVCIDDHSIHCMNMIREVLKKALYRRDQRSC